MAVATPIPFVKARFFDRCGKPLAGGKVYTYEPHSTTPKATYTAPISGTPNTNPIILDAAGEANIYLAGRYRIIVTDSKGAVVNDNDDVGSWYSGDLDSQLESINQYLNNAGDALTESQQERIDAMVNSGLVGAGSTDLLVSLGQRNQRDKNNDGINPCEFGAAANGATDDTAALLAACNAAYANKSSLRLRNDQRFFINGQVYFDCSINGGIFILGPNADVRLRIKDAESLRVVEAQFINQSGNDLKQALICESNDTTKKGYVYLDVQLNGFLNGVYGKYLKIFCTEPTFYAYSRNTVAGRYAESHCACVNTDLFVAQGISDGGVVGFSSGAGVVREIYNTTSMNSYDHGVYSSSPSGKLLTIFDNCKSIDAGGSGLKCFSNGELYINNPTVKNAGKIGIIPVAQRAYISGGTVDGCVDAAVYQIGKEFGAGINTFDKLVVSGLTVRNGQSDGIRIYGPDSLNSVEINNCDIDVARRPFVNLINNVDTATNKVEIKGGKLKSTNAIDQLVYSTGTVNSFVIDGTTLVADTTTANLIDVNADTLQLTRLNYRFTQAARLVRNRKVGGQIIECATVYRGALTGAPLVQQDSGTFTSRNTVFDDTGNPLVVAYANASPTTGTWAKGSIVFNRAANAGTNAGWICITNGTPGTWVPFGTIQLANTYNPTNVSTARSFDASTATPAELASALGTLINDLKAAKLLS